MDILERMRSGSLCAESGNRCRSMEARSGCDCATAADAIERLTAENERLRAALEKLAVLGEHGMAPSYGEWLSFHDKVAVIANDALRSCQQQTMTGET